ncbi:Uncharacterized protein APZ42_027353 [Daphnia magna]|uniref:Uncharacterized protein n=1 Tax=Daphnia magna TaxID=35525 RepID=A0A164RH90_9CRUS|nr:Uncharacterized protein APZ42_027353 [Daphnia magna]
MATLRGRETLGTVTPEQIPNPKQNRVEGTHVTNALLTLTFVCVCVCMYIYLSVYAGAWCTVNNPSYILVFKTLFFLFIIFLTGSTRPMMF